MCVYTYNVYICITILEKRNSMKSKFTIALATVAVVILTSCGGGKSSEKAQSTEKSESGTISSFQIDTEASTVTWLGEVAGVYGHNGQIEIAEGTIEVSGDEITGGKVVIDMTTIQPTDSASYKDEDGRRASDLVGHLSTGDFFLVETYPTSSFVIKSVKDGYLIGDLTVRGITKEEKAKLTSVEITEKGVKASADLVFNRQDYKVSWVHFMKDMVLSDDIKIGIELVAKK